MPGSTDSKRNQRIALRTTRIVKRAIERAAALNGQSLTDFVVTKAYESALETLERHDRMVLSGGDRDAFIDALIDVLGDPDASENTIGEVLHRLMKHAGCRRTHEPKRMTYKAWITEDTKQEGRDWR